MLEELRLDGGGRGGEEAWGEVGHQQRGPEGRGEELGLEALGQQVG